MEQKAKFIIIGLAGFCLVCLFLFIQSVSQQQKLQRESNDLKTENTTLVNKANKLESDLRENQGRINALTAERDRGIEELNTLQRKLETATAARDELIEKLKEKSRQQQSQVITPALETPASSAPVPGQGNNDAYWATVLKSKNELEMHLAEVKAQLKNLQQLNEALRNEKRKTEAEIHLESQLGDVRSELRELQINNESLRREKGILEMDINNLRNEKKDLQRQLDYNQKLLDSMSQEVVRERNDKLTMTETFKNVKASNAVLTRQLKSLTGRKMALDKKVQELQQNKAVLEKRMSEMEKTMSGRSSKINALKNELETLKNSDEAVSSGDGAVELPAIVVSGGGSANAQRSSAQVVEFPGKILAVNLDSNFVVIDSGSSSGVRVGDMFSVSRAGQSVGNIQVIQTRDAIAACDIKRMTSPLRIGDLIKKQ